MSDGVDPALIGGWLAARSVARGLPMPRPDRGGFRVDTGAPAEIRRWVFPHLCSGLTELGREVSEPFHFVKLCGTDAVLAAALPKPWRLQAISHVMVRYEGCDTGPPELPRGYGLETVRNGPVARVCIAAPDGSLAASGYAAEAQGTFAYDRIVTTLEHRGRGLGTAVMNALASAARLANAQEILVATDDGRRLYQKLGWSIYSPYATAVIPALP